MSDRRPSCFFPHTNKGIAVVVMIYLAVAGLSLFQNSWYYHQLDYGVPLIALHTALVLAVTAVVIAVVRHYRFVVPHDREARFHCPKCDYDIGEDIMESGCPECGWQRGNA